jgi:hypothetical protein
VLRKEVGRSGWCIEHDPDAVVLAQCAVRVRRWPLEFLKNRHWIRLRWVERISGVLAGLVVSRRLVACSSEVDRQRHMRWCEGKVESDLSWIEMDGTECVRVEDMCCGQGRLRGRRSGTLPVRRMSEE